MSEESVYNLARKPTVEIIDASKPNAKLVLIFDAIRTEDHTMSATVTEHPVENGSIISDHVIQQPDKLTITGLVSNTPIDLIGSYAVTGKDDVLLTAETIGAVKPEEATGAPKSGNIFTSKLGANYLINKGSSNARSNAAYIIMKNFLKNAIPVVVRTGLDVYTDMIITDMRTNRDARNGDSWSPSITFQKIERVQSKQVKIKIQKKGQPRNSSTKKEDKGKVNPLLDPKNPFNLRPNITPIDNLRVAYRPKPNGW